MLEKEVFVTIEHGLHARPAAELVKMTRNYTCDIYIEIASRNYSAKSILGLMSASIRQGEQIKIITDGTDEAEAMKWICEFLGKQE